MGNIDYGMMAAFVVLILVLYVIGKSMAKPAMFFGKLIFNVILGGMLLVLVNYIGKFIQFHIALNIFTAFIVGFLGIPGIVLLVILSIIFIQKVKNIESDANRNG